MLPRPSPFSANWAQPGDAADRYARPAGSVREDSCPFNVTNETAPAWDYVQHRAMQRERQRAARDGAAAAAADTDDESGHEDNVMLPAPNSANATITTPVRNSANATSAIAAAGWNNAAEIVQANDRAMEDAARYFKSEPLDKAPRAVAQAIDQIYYSATFYQKPPSSENHQRYMYFLTSQLDISTEPL